MAPAFEHHAKVPVVQSNRLKVSVIAGEMLGERSPAAVHTPLVGASIVAPAVTYGRAEIAGQRIIPGSLVYLKPGRTGLPIVTGAGDAGIVVVGGQPFPEQILMWWNFVGRTKDELTQASRDWNAAADYLGEVKGAQSERLVAPLPPWAEGPPTVTIQI
jgi:redox-sensitive bicupin YhaK (pirin superfamily)